LGVPGNSKAKEVVVAVTGITNNLNCIKPQYSKKIWGSPKLKLLKNSVRNLSIPFRK
jgi:hypothetical protein